MKNQKYNTGFAFFIGIIFGITASVISYLLITKNAVWKNYFDEKIIPSAVLVITASFSVAVAVIPVARKVISALSLFDGATKNIKRTAENGESNEERIRVLAENIDVEFQKITRKIDSEFEKNRLIAEESFKASTEKTEKKISESRLLAKKAATASENAEKILKIGFGNISELVRKGYANEIFKVGEVDEKNEKTTDSI